MKLQPDDTASRLRSLGLPVRGQTFRQPCAAWQNCRCTIYPDRPSHCRNFDCLLLKEVAAKRLSRDEALNIIRCAQKKAARVRELLSALDPVEQDCDLRSQYRRVSKLAESKDLNREEAAVYSRLTLEFHALDQLLRASFYCA